MRYASGEEPRVGDYVTRDYRDSSGWLYRDCRAIVVDVHPSGEFIELNNREDILEAKEFKLISRKENAMKYKVGDVLENINGKNNKRKVLGICGEVYLMSSSSCLGRYGCGYTEKDLNANYKLSSPTVKVEMDNETYEKVKNGFGDKVKEIK